MLLYTYVQRPLEDPAHPNAVDLPSPPRAPLSLADVLALLPPHDRARAANGAAFLRARVADPNFGYIWCARVMWCGTGADTRNHRKDIRDPNSAVPTVGDNIICRVGFFDELRTTSERAPVVRPGMTKAQAAMTTPASSRPPMPAAAPPKPAAKAPATTAAKQEVQEPRKRKQDAVEEEPGDGLTPDERARRRIEAREAAEAAEMARKVSEVRGAEERKTSEHDARAQMWTELRPALEGWSGTDANRKPVRALLSNLHTVLWEEARWTPVTVLVRPNEVRLAYRKAMLVVHPDKIPAGSPVKTTVIAKHCFEALNSAYEKFEKAEMG